MREVEMMEEVMELVDVMETELVELEVMVAEMMVVMETEMMMGQRW